jgi:hypothetical protein
MTARQAQGLQPQVSDPNVYRALARIVVKSRNAPVMAGTLPNALGSAGTDSEAANAI